MVKRKTILKNRSRRHPNAFDNMKIISYHESLNDYMKVSEASGWSYGLCYRIIQRWKESKSIDRKRGQGKKRKTTQKDDIFIAEQVKRNRNVTRDEILKSLPHVKVHKSTISRRIYECSELSSK